MGEACFDPASCRDTLEGIKKLGADHLVILIEQEELDALGFDLLKVTAGEVGIELLFRPITDYAAPNAELIEWWDATTDWRANLFNTQGALAFACQYGAGRSGTMAALCLIEQGATATDAIARVRQEFSEAIESEAQENWLHEVGQGNAAG